MKTTAKTGCVRIVFLLATATAAMNLLTDAALAGGKFGP